MKSFKNIFPLFITLLLLHYSCERHEVGLQINADVTIHGLSIADREGRINEGDKVIVVEVPEGTDLTNLYPAVSLDAGAVLLPDITAGYDFSNPVSVKVINGDLYSEYTIQVSYIDVSFNAFYVNGVRGIVNDAERTVTVVLPDGTDITGLSINVELPAGASISPEISPALDFSAPVSLTITNQGASRTYSVIVKIQETLIGFLGTYADSLSITDDDEKAAAKWLFENYENARYISFDEIKNGEENLSSYRLLWWYHDAYGHLPEIAIDPLVLNAITSYYKNGGNLLLNTHAVGYLWPMGRITNNYAKAVGTGGGFDLNDTWYVGVTVGGNLQPHDKSTHPVYEGLSVVIQPNGDKWIPLISPGWAEDHNHVIIEIAPFHGYDYGNAGAYNAFQQANQVEWLGVWAGNRDFYMAGVMELLPTDLFQGRAIAQGLGAFEFNREAKGNLSPEGVNLYQSNVERFTKNAIRYLLTN